MAASGPIRLHVGDRPSDERALGPYLLLAEAKVPFERVADEGASGPWLEEGGQRFEGLLAIADRIAAIAGSSAVWPSSHGAAARAVVEAASAAWPAITAAYPYALTPPLPEARPTPAAARELDALSTLLLSAPGGGPLLFGGFSAADAALAPLAVRLRAHQVAVSPRVAAWIDAVLERPAVERWVRRAREA